MARVFGAIPGVAIGTTFVDRRAVAASGVHKPVIARCDSGRARHGSYGLGIVVQQDGCAVPASAYGHNGAGDGYMSSVQVSPDGSRVAVVLVNGFAVGRAAQDRGSATLVTTMQRLYCAA